MNQEKDFDRWNEVKKHLDSKAGPMNLVNKGEVWWCSLGVNIGHEQNGKRDLFDRPVIVLKKFSSDGFLIIPITSKIKRGPYYRTFVHGQLIQCALISQIRFVSNLRLRKWIYKMDVVAFNQIYSAVRDML